MGLEVNGGAGPMPKCRNGTPAALKSESFFGRMVFSSFKCVGPDSSVTNLRDREGYKKAASQG